VDGYKIVFATTAGVKRVFPSTSVSNSFFETSVVKSIFPTTTFNQPFFETSGVKYAFPTTAYNNPFFETSGLTRVFPVVLTDDTSKLLKLNFGSFDLSSDYSTIGLADNTGEYNSETNPGGYNPEADPTDPNRAKRSEIKLWLAYRIWKDTNAPDTLFPSPVNPDLNPWEYTLPIEEQGVYQMFMIASPTDEVFEDVEGKGNSIFQYAKQDIGWYSTTGLAIVDEELINCLNRSRYAFLESVICGDCDEGYLELYSKYIGVLSAFEIATDEAISQGMALIAEIKDECNKLDCNCNC
jgi:hypothetical protein